jgi:hypothetical protein
MEDPGEPCEIPEIAEQDNTVPLAELLIDGHKEHVPAVVFV